MSVPIVFKSSQNVNWSCYLGKVFFLQLVDQRPCRGIHSPSLCRLSNSVSPYYSWSNTLSIMQDRNSFFGLFSSKIHFQTDVSLMISMRPHHSIAYFLHMVLSPVIVSSKDQMYKKVLIFKHFSLPLIQISKYENKIKHPEDLSLPIFSSLGQLINPLCNCQLLNPYSVFIAAPLIEPQDVEV